MIQSILFFLNSSSMPPVSPLTILSLRACTWSMSMPMAASPIVRPHSFQSCATFSACACSSSAFVGNAAPVEAGPAEHRRALDDRGFEPELRRADGGDVAAGARADHDDVVFVRHQLLVFLPHGGERDEGDRRGFRRRGSAAALASGLVGIEARDLRPQPRVVVPQLPVGLVQRIELRATGAATQTSAMQRTEQPKACDDPREPQPTYLTKTTVNTDKPGKGGTKTRYNLAFPMADLEDDPDLRRRSGDAGHDCRDPEARLPRADRLERRGGADAAEAGGRRPHPARRPAARDQRLRRAAHRQGELQPRSSAS